jgi:hypothetical protein
VFCNIATTVKTLFRLVGHVADIEERRYDYNILFGNLFEKTNEEIEGKR